MTARREVKNCAREITSTFPTRFREANRRDVGKQNLFTSPPPFRVRLRLPSLPTPIPRETSAARPARALPFPFRAEARPQTVPEARHARRP